MTDDVPYPDELRPARCSVCERTRARTDFRLGLNEPCRYCAPTAPRKSKSSSTKRQVPGIYALLDPPANGGRVRYVGESLDLKARRGKHINEARRIKYSNEMTPREKWFLELARLPGRPEPIFRVLEIHDVNDREHRYAREAFYIAGFLRAGHPLTNIAIDRRVPSLGLAEIPHVENWRWAA